MKVRLLALVLVLSIFLPSERVVRAEDTPTPSPSSTTPTPTSDYSSEKLSGLKDRIKELEGKVNELQTQEKSLSSQIAVMDNQIKLTEYRINATEEEIVELTDDIAVATNKVGNLEKSLGNITKVLMSRIVATYQIGSVQPVQILLTASDVSNFVQRANYLRIVQVHDKKLIYDTQQAKIDYQNQKDIYEGKKEKVEALKVQLEGYTAQLDADRKTKKQLLDVTKNDEVRYQQLLAAARSERNAIEGVISSIQLKDGTPITKGQTIAVVGNSGAPYCSTGPHLHFEVRRNGSLENPASFLRGGVNFSYSYGSDQYDYYGSISPGGDWDWPLDEPITINQGYGSHGYAQSFYPGGVHTGIDMDSDSSSLIKAPKDGTLYRGSTSCAGAAMNYVAVDHGGGIVSWYWHVR